MSRSQTRPAPTGLLSGADVDPVTGGLLSIAQLQQLLRSRQTCRAPGPLPGTPPPPRAGQLPTAGTPAPLGQPVGWLTPPAGGGLVAVVGAHPGAGCSTVALAVADAAARAGDVQLVEYAAAARSGLAGVTRAELGATPGGWRRGRRGRVMLARPVDQIPQVAPDFGPDAAGVVVADLGHLDLVGTAVAGLEVSAEARLVVVCRASVPGVRRAEQLLARLDRPVAVAVVGPARWPGVVLASGGPRLAAVRQSGLMVAVPLARRLQVDGPSSAGLPRGVMAAGRALWRLLEHEEAITGIALARTGELS